MRIRRSVVLLGTVSLLWSAPPIGAVQPSGIFVARCAPCHPWAGRPAGIEAHGADVLRRLRTNDAHVVGRLDGGEKLVLEQALTSAGPKQPSPSARPLRSEPPERWTEYLPPVDTTSHGIGPFTPCELGCDDPLPSYERPRCRACESPASLSGRRARALRDIGIHCGRCHGWATRPHLIVREHARIIPRILSGHGVRTLARERRTFMLEAFRPDFVTPHLETAATAGHLLGTAR